MDMKYVVFFVKQKKAYEIKECDWSSDVCSSDLDDRFVIFETEKWKGDGVSNFIVFYKGKK